MSDKKRVVISVNYGLTEKQAGNLSAEIIKAKQKIAPNGRGTIAITTHEGVARVLQKETRKIGK